jgi:hypothetical protein
MPRKKKKSWWIDEMINQVDHGEAAGSQAAEKSELCGLGGASKGVRMQSMTGTNQAFHPKKTSVSMKSGPSEVESGRQAALWAEALKSAGLGWV